MKSFSLFVVCFVVYFFIIVDGQTPVVNLVSSISATTDRLTPQPPIPFKKNGGGPTLSVFPNVHYQSILGFGGALTDASAVSYFKLPTNLQQEVIQAYYNATSGNGYTWGRVPLNSCDFSTMNYNYDDVADDFTLSRWDYNATHDRAGMIPLIQAAQKAATNNLRLFATPWSPPGWMKTNGQMNGSGRPCLKTDPRYRQTWANYFVKWFQTWQSFGIPFWGLTIQNEPENAGEWDSCVYTPEEELDFLVNYLYPTLQKSFPELNIMFFDHNKDHSLDWASVFYANPLAYEIVYGIAIHWYSGDSFDNVEQIHEGWPNKHIMATEACNCGGPHYNAWDRAETYVHDILGDLNAWAQGWTDWNILLDQQGGPNHVGNYCDAPLIARFDQNPVQLVYQDTYYAMGHFSRFLPEGAIRIAHQYESGTTTLEYATFIVYLDQTGESWTKRIAKERMRQEGNGKMMIDAVNAEIVIIIANRQTNAQSITIEANGWFASVPIPAHSIHSLTYSTSIYNSSSIVLPTIRHE